MTKAILLVGGKGTRLKPITDIIPKPLVPLNNIPILEWQIKYLKKFHIRDFVISTGYKSEQIIDYLQQRNNLKVNIQYSIEKSPLGTGGAIKKAGSLLSSSDKSFLVMNGDIITNINIKKLEQKTNTIAAVPLRTKFGILDITHDKINNFLEKKELTNTWMNAGIYHLSKNILSDLPHKGDIEKTTFPKYAKTQKLNTIKFDGAKWYSIDSFKDIDECSKDIRNIIK
jgi:NDP-sugar pyrophosphorylase family protein